MSNGDSENGTSGCGGYLSPAGRATPFDRDTYHAVFEHLLNGAAYCRMLFDGGRPCDFRFLYVNPAFERQTKLRDVVGRRATELVPGIDATDPRLFEILGRIARGDESEKFEIYLKSLTTWLSVSAYSPAPDHFVAMFDVVTERKLAEELLRRSQERYLDVFDNTSDLIQCSAPDGSFLYTNRAWREALGYTEEEVRSLSLVDVLHPDSLDCCQDRFRRLLEGETLTCITFKFITRTGEPVYLSGDCGSIVRDGMTISTRGIFRNITDTVEAEAALKTSEIRYQALYEHAPDLYATVNRAGEIQSINRTGAAMLDYQPAELIGESIARIIHPEDQRTAFEHIEARFTDSGPDRGIEYRGIRKDGSSFWIQQRATLDPDIGGPRLLVVGRDITERRKLEEQLAYQAAHDTLTNLINRREFERRLQRVLARPSERDIGHVLCFLDLDQFKIINDTCGHIAGDELLRQVAALLQGRMRSRDTLARLGGDEFGILMEYCSVSSAVNVAAKIQKNLRNFLFHWRSRQFRIGISIGILQIRSGRSVTETLSRADSACYVAKKASGNGIHIYTPGDAAPMV
ncbi:MAG: PAS domain S-box protein [Thiohalobacteraceae bacterium]